MAAVKLPPSAGVAKIVPGAYGDPNGTGDAWMARPVLSYAMLDNSPRTRAQAAPVYPSEARRQGLAGEVWVEFMVDEDGRVLNPRVVRSSDAMFESATLNAVLKWRFEPGQGWETGAFSDGGAGGVWIGRVARWRGRARIAARAANGRQPRGRRLLRAE
jgi:TonB family protein